MDGSIAAISPTCCPAFRKKRQCTKSASGSACRRFGIISLNGVVTAIRSCGFAGGQVAKGMKNISYKGYRFPPEIIQQAIWLYVRFTLSFRDVEDLLAERAIMVSYETVRRWVNHFGPKIAAACVNADPSPIRLGIWTKSI